MFIVVIIFLLVSLFQSISSLEKQAQEPLSLTLKAWCGLLKLDKQTKICLYFPPKKQALINQIKKLI